MSNLSKKRRMQMIKFLNKLREEHTDDTYMIAINEIENFINEKKYGLVWEEHSERVDEKMVLNIPVFKEVEYKKIRMGESNNFNFLLEGDNLHSLKLLEKTHKEKIDLIYIDPPYNTGNEDFLYDDNYVVKDDGFRHSKWLSFMSKRLIIARHLLTNRGIIYISIGDDEQAQLKLLCDEIFGEANCISNCIRIQKRTSNKGNYFKPTKDYVIVYAKDIKQIDWKFGIAKEIDLSQYKYEDEKGIYRKNGASLYQPSLDSRPNQRYWIKCPDGSLIIPPGNVFPEKLEDAAHVTPQSNDDKVWRWSYETYLKNKDMLMFTKASNRCPLIDSKGNPSKWNIYDKVYLSSDEEQMLLPEDVIYDYVNSQGTKEVLRLGLKFNYAKPVGLIKYLIELSQIKRDAVILDFFAGSGTTGQAVLELNKKDGGNRKYILCTNNENNICEEVTYERMFRLQEELPHNLKYLQTKFIPKLSDDEDIISDRLLVHIKEMVELENMCEIDGEKHILILSDEDMDNAMGNEFENCIRIYLPSYILLTREQENLIWKHKIEVIDIPDYYFLDELREVSEI